MLSTRICLLILLSIFVGAAVERAEASDIPASSDGYHPPYHPPSALQHPRLDVDTTVRGQTGQDAAGDKGTSTATKESTPAQSDTSSPTTPGPGLGSSAANGARRDGDERPTKTRMVHSLIATIPSPTPPNPGSPGPVMSFGWSLTPAAAYLPAAHSTQSTTASEPAGAVLPAGHVAQELLTDLLSTSSHAVVLA